MKSDEQLEKEARREVKMLRHFYSHLTTYVVVIGFLHILNLMTSSYYWAIWPTLGWGVAVVLHATQIFNFLPYFDQDWEEKQFQKIMAKKKGASK